MYIGSCAGAFLRLDRTRGTLLASYNVQQDSVHRQFHGDPSIWNDLILIATDAAPGDSAWLMAFDRTTLHVRWRIRLGRGSMSNIPIVDGRAYSVTLQDELICFDPTSGARIWSYGSHAETDLSWPRSPILLNDRVFFCDRDGTVHAVDPATGRGIWKHPLQEVRTGMVTAQRQLYLLRGQGTLVALDPASGEERGRSPIPGGPYFGQLVVPTDSTLLLLGERAVTCYDLTHHRVRWTHSEARPWSSARPYVWRDLVLAGTEGGQLFGYRLSDGAEQWVHSLSGMIRGIGTAGDTLYIGTFRGQVHALVPRE